jgi:hypothetical protein
MKNFFLFGLSLLLSQFAFSQSNYLTSTNRVILSTIVNSDTVIVENLKNKVRVNGELGLLEVVYDNYDARLVKDRSNPEERTSMVINFSNEYPWLDERIKTTENVIQFSDELNIEISGEEQTVPVNFIINRIRGAQGFLVMMEIRGQFSALGLEDHFPKLKFESDLSFAIFLTIQVLN